MNDKITRPLKVPMHATQALADVGDSESVPSKPSQVAAELARLGEELEKLQQLIDTLGDRLKPILLTDKSEKGIGEECVPNVLVPLASMIRDRRYAVERSAAYLHDLIEKLDL